MKETLPCNRDPTSCRRPKRFCTHLLKSKGCNAIRPCGYCSEDLNNLNLKASCIPCCGERKCIHLAKHYGSKRIDQRYWKNVWFFGKKIFNLSCWNFAHSILVSSTADKYHVFGKKQSASRPFNRRFKYDPPPPRSSSWAGVNTVRSIYFCYEIII